MTSCKRCTFIALAASAPCSNPHVFNIHSGSVRGAALLAQKNYKFKGGLV